MTVEQVWSQFAQQENLGPHQLEQFKIYYECLDEWSKKTNLTAITSFEEIISYHFKDSLYLGHCYDLSTISYLCDVGTGAGFPALPLKIKYPHLKMVLLGVNNKKVTFLEHLISLLNLSDITVCSLDWRTFLRTVHEPIDMFISRAALPPQELLRALSSGFGHEKSVVVYWASDTWQANTKEEPYLMKKELYQVGARNRKLIFFHNPKQAHSL